MLSIIGFNFVSVWIQASCCIRCMGLEVIAACTLAVLLLVMLAAHRHNNIPVEGYWLSSDGTLHEIVAKQEDNIRILGGSGHGIDARLRRGKITAGPEAGRVRYGGRQIVWGGGKVWTRQGVR
jgi:hypothetical protein